MSSNYMMLLFSFVNHITLSSLETGLGLGYIKVTECKMCVLCEPFLRQY